MTIKKTDLVNLVVDRCKVARASDDPVLMIRIQNQIRGMVWLYNGEDPGRLSFSMDIANALKIKQHQFELMMEM